MLREFYNINQSNIKELNTIVKKINNSSLNEIFFFPFNIYSQYLYKKISLKKNKFAVDNYSTKKGCLKPNNLKNKKNFLLVVTDKKLYLDQDFQKNIRKIFFKPKILTNKKIDLDKKKLRKSNFNELFSYYNTDKSKIFRRLDIKQKTNNYGPFYEKHLKKLKNKKLNILEIGSYMGSSTAAFLGYFKNANLYCLDINHKNFLFKSERIYLLNFDYMNKKKMKNFTNQYKDFFDIIIDDGGHYKSHILNNLKNFYNCLNKSNSFYIIEDFGLKFDYLNDIKSEPNIFKVIKCIKEKKLFKSKILNKKFQLKLKDSIKKIHVHQGSWVKFKKNISDICFINLNNY